MKAVFEWIDERTGLASAWRGFANHAVPGGSCPCRVWPAAILFTFLVQAITGWVVWTYYVPVDQAAWESVYYLQHEVVGGAMLRGIHHYGGQVLLVLIILYLLQMVFTRACRAPRELVFWTALGMGLVCLGLLLTGDLLAWDQNSYASTHVRVSFLKLIPVVGGDLFKVAVGGPGPGFGHLTLPRFMALHVTALAGGFFLLIVLHWILADRADRRQAETAERTTTRWPSQTMFSALACLLVMGVILGLSTSHGLSGEAAGAGLGSPADTDPANKYAAARPEWAFLGLYEMAHMFGETFPWAWGGVPIFVLPGLLVLIGLAMPFLARVNVGHYFNMAFTVILLVVMVGLSYRCLGRDAGDRDHQKAIAAEVQQASRVVQLAKAGGGIPPAGALSLLKDDAKTQGPLLFARHCASCHNYTGGEVPDIAAEESSAPNIYQFASTGWIGGFLDREKISGPEYFGNTAFKDGTMVKFVRGNLKELREDMPDEFPQLIAALAEEATFDDARPADQISEDTVFLFDDFTCTECHKFHEEGDLGSAPDLTGYGSRAWLVGIISDPTHKRFYRSDNDRMPAYASDSENPENNVLSPRQVEMLADWLRGKWYEP